MKKIRIYLAAIVATMAVFGVKAELKEFVYKVGEFDRLNVLENLNVVYSSNKDSIGLAVYRTPEDIGDCFYITARNGGLKIQTEVDYEVADSLPTLYVYSSYLTEVKNGSNGRVIVKDPAPCAEFKAQQIGNGKLVVEGLKATRLHASLNTGNGTVVLRGQCDDARLKMVGTGLIQADELKCQQARCSIAGTGAIGVWAQDLLKVVGMGSTTIYVKGNPEIKQNSLGAKIVKIHSETDAAE